MSQNVAKMHHLGGLESAKMHHLGRISTLEIIPYLVYLYIRIKVYINCS